MYSRDKIYEVMYDIYNNSRNIKPYVVIAQPRRVEGETPAQQLDGYTTHIDMLGYSHGFCNIFGEKVDVARNYLMEQALESGAKYLFFVGEDTVIPYDGFVKLHKTAEENPNSIVVGVYYIKLSNPMIMVNDGEWIRTANVDPGQVFEALMCGMDCMLIPIEILKRMKEQEPELPFCCIGNNINGEIPFIGEDNFFIHRVHKMGVKVLVNTDVQCLHMDLATGKYTAHPSIDKRNYYTNIPVTEPLKMEDKQFIDERWLNRLPEGSNSVDKKIKELLENKQSIKVHFGGKETSLESHVNLDYDKDLISYGLNSNSVDEILVPYVVEYMPQNKVADCLKSWYDALKPNGKFVCETIDLEKLCDKFAQAKTDEERYSLSLCIYGTNSNQEQNSNETKNTSHVWGYSSKTLKNMLERIGFKDVQILPPHHNAVAMKYAQLSGENFRIEAIK